MMIFLQITFAARFPFKTKIKCPYCDPNYIDVPNMQSALQGYDLPMGDPNCNIMPSFKTQIDKSKAE